MASTNSIIVNNYASAEPKVGGGATIIMFSDRHACTIIFVSGDQKTVIVQEDTATPRDKIGPDRDQNYDYSRNPNGRVLAYRWHEKSGHWKPLDLMTMKKIEANGDTLMIGGRDHHYDFNR